MKFLPSYYEALKREVSELTDQLVPVLSDDERRWIAEWISVGEYGLAVIGIGLEDEVREYLPPD